MCNAYDVKLHRSWCPPLIYTATHHIDVRQFKLKSYASTSWSWNTVKFVIHLIRRQQKNFCATGEFLNSCQARATGLNSIRGNHITKCSSSSSISSGRRRSNKKFISKPEWTLGTLLLKMLKNLLRCRGRTGGRLSKKSGELITKLKVDHRLEHMPLVSCLL